MTGTLSPTTNSSSPASMSTSSHCKKAVLVLNSSTMIDRKRKRASRGRRGSRRTLCEKLQFPSSTAIPLLRLPLAASAARSPAGAGDAAASRRSLLSTAVTRGEGHPSSRGAARGTASSQVERGSGPRGLRRLARAHAQDSFSPARAGSRGASSPSGEAPDPLRDDSVHSGGERQTGRSHRFEDLVSIVSDRGDRSRAAAGSGCRSRQKRPRFREPPRGAPWPPLVSSGRSVEPAANGYSLRRRDISVEVISDPYRLPGESRRPSSRRRPLIRSLSPLASFRVLMTSTARSHAALATASRTARRNRRLAVARPSDTKTHRL